MVICKAVTAPRNGPGTASKGLVVQPYIGDGPIQVPPSQGLFMSLLARASSGPS